MTQEYSGELPPLPEILQKYGDALEAVAVDQTRPLELIELPRLVEAEKLPWTHLDSHQVLEIVGWPTRATWAGEPSVQFGGGESGDLEFFAKALENSDATADQLTGLNNFWAILHTKPYAFDGETPTSTREIAYAPMPALIRAWTLFPEFMSALQAEMRGMRSMFEVGEEFAEQLEAEEPQLLRASRLAYGLMTRLVCADDHELQAKLQNSMFPAPTGPEPTRHFRRITDPSAELWS